MYELLYIVPAIYTEDELKGVTVGVETLLKEQGAEIVNSKNVGKLKLSYPIKKQTVGYYILLVLDMEKESLKTLNRVLQLEKNILRFMLTRKVEGAKEVKIAEFKQEDITAKKPERRKEVKRTQKDKIKLEDIEKKLDTLLEKEIV